MERGWQSRAEMVSEDQALLNNNTTRQLIIVDHATPPPLFFRFSLLVWLVVFFLFLSRYGTFVMVSR